MAARRGLLDFLLGLAFFSMFARFAFAVRAETPVSETICKLSTQVTILDKTREKPDEDLRGIWFLMNCEEPVRDVVFTMISRQFGKGKNVPLPFEIGDPNRWIPPGLRKIKLVQLIDAFWGSYVGYTFTLGYNRSISNLARTLAEQDLNRQNGITTIPSTSAELTEADLVREQTSLLLEEPAPFTSTTPWKSTGDGPPCMLEHKLINDGQAFQMWLTCDEQIPAGAVLVFPKGFQDLKYKNPLGPGRVNLGGWALNEKLKGQSFHLMTAAGRTNEVVL